MADTQRNRIISASILGVSGFTGAEVLRILLRHPHVRLSHLVARTHAGAALGTVFPRLSGSACADMRISDADPERVARESDIVFLCLPHETTQDIMPHLLGKTRIVDLSADFRLATPELYQRYYGSVHKCPQWLGGRFVYGAPEFFRESIQKADAVANPGCYALLVQAMLRPFRGVMHRAQVVAMSGTSGAGRVLCDPADHAVLSGNMTSYKVNAHRHIPEILATTGLTTDTLDFVPTLGPWQRGIFATAFLQVEDIGVQGDFRDSSPFLRHVPQVRLGDVVGTNFLDLHVTAGRGGLIVQGALDNLLKGAAGTAVQNMNLMCGFPETAGLDFVSPLYP